MQTFRYLYILTFIILMTTMKKPVKSLHCTHCNLVTYYYMMDLLTKIWNHIVAIAVHICQDNTLLINDLVLL